MSLSRPRLVAIIVALISMPCAAFGQAARPSPRLNTVLPAGGTIGGSVEVSLAGTDIDTADALWFSDPEVTAAPVAGKPKTFKVMIGPALKPGEVDVRVLTKDGISNPRTFCVGQLPEVSEVEPNHEPATAKPIVINSVVNGTVSQTDVDWFSFEGKRGQRVVISLAAQRVASKLDGTLHLYSSRGVELAESRDADGTDALIEIALPADDVYKIKLHDMTYAGSPEHFYRLTLHTGPVLDAIFPAISGRGGERIFTLFGRNLGPGAKTTAGLESLTKTIRPEFTSADFLPAPLYGTAVAMRGQAVTHGSSNPVLISAADEPVVEESEPNGLDHPQMVTPPVAVAGDFRQERDLDVYRFTAKKGEVWRVEAIAQGIGSTADPTFTIQNVPKTGEPGDLALADDTNDPGLAPRLDLASTDATLRWSVPEDGTYQVVLNDLAGGSRGGPKLFYRLSIRREEPTVRLFLVPTTPNALDSIALRRGGRTSAIVLAWRVDGFTGPIWVMPAGLPKGVKAEPVVIAAGSNQTPIVFETEANAPIGAGIVSLAGSAFPKVTAPAPSAIPPANWTGMPPLVYVVPVAPVWPAVKLPNSQRTPSSTVRATHGFAVAIREGSPFLLTAKPGRNVVDAGSSLPVDLTLTRSAGADDAITLAAADLPPSFTPPQGSLAKGVNMLHIDWPIAKNVTPGIYSLVIRGTGTFKPDPKGPAFKVDEPSNPIVIAVRAAPVALTLVSKPSAFNPGETQTVEVKVERLNGFAGPVMLHLDAPPEKLTAADVTVAPKDTSGKLVITASKNSAAGAVSATIMATAGSFVSTLPLTVTIAKIVSSR